MIRIALPKKNFTIKYDTNIPRQVVSCIIVRYALHVIYLLGHFSYWLSYLDFILYIRVGLGWEQVSITV